MDNILKPVLIAVIIILAVLIIWKANRFTTAEVKIDMSGMNNNISNGMDLDGVVSVMAEGVAEAIDTAAEGVHE